MFNENQQKLIVEFFANLGTEIGDPGSESYRKIKTDSKWFPDLDEMLPIVNEVLSENPEKIALLDDLLKAYNSTPYSADKSKSIIIRSLDTLSEKFEADNIPLIYTTSLMPDKDSVSNYIWPSLSSIKSFVDEDYGHLQLINVILDLRLAEVIEIKSFSILELDPRQLIVRVMVSYNKQPIFTGKHQVYRGKLKPDSTAKDFSCHNDGSIRYRGEIIEMREQLRLIARLFISQPNSIVTRDDIKDILFPDETGQNRKWAEMPKETVAKYVGALRKIFEGKSRKSLLVNQKDTGWIFKP